MGTAARYPTELKQRAVRLVLEAGTGGDPVRHETALAMLGPLVERATVDELVSALRPA